MQFSHYPHYNTNSQTINTKQALEALHKNHFVVFAVLTVSQLLEFCG
jgi:hypothetical protein